MRRRLVRWLGVLTGLAMLATIAGVLVIRSDWFADIVRRRIVEEVERASGGRAEIGSFQFDWRNLDATVAPFVLHGTEPEGAPPLLSADRVHLGLRLISALERKADIRALDVDRPQVHIIVKPDGSTNVPEPKLRSNSGRSATDELLDLAVQKFTINNGSFEYDAKTIPLNLRGEDLNLTLEYERGVLERKAPRYRGKITARQLTVASDFQLPLGFDAATDFAFDRKKLEVTGLRLAMKETRIEASGSLVDFQSPKLDVSVKAVLALREIGKPLRLPLEPQGTVRFEGVIKGALGQKPDYKVTGKLAAAGLGYSRGGVEIRGASLTAGLKLDPSRLDLDRLLVQHGQATLRGKASLSAWRKLHAEGELAKLELADIVKQALHKESAWSGTVAGPVSLDLEIDGQKTNHLRVKGDLAIAPLEGRIPIQGSVQGAYDQESGLVEFGESYINLPHTRLTASGTLGASLHATVAISQMDDLLPALALAGSDLKKFPFALKAQASADATIAGPISDPRINGVVTAGRFSLDPLDNFKPAQDFDSAAATFDADSTGIRLRDLSLQRGLTVVNGPLNLLWSDWKLGDATGLNGSLTVKALPLKQVLAETGHPEINVQGTAAGSVKLAGTIAAPVLDTQVVIEKPDVYGEHFDRIRAAARYTEKGVELRSALAEEGRAQIRLTGAYERAGKDWKNGSVRFETSGGNFRLTQTENLRRYSEHFDGGVKFHLTGSAAVRDGDFRLLALGGDASLDDVTYDQRPIGSLALTAASQPDVLRVKAEGVVGAAQVRGGAEWRLTGDYPGKGQLQFAAMRLALVQDFFPDLFGKERPPSGSIDGNISFELALKKLDEARAQLMLTSLELRPNSEQRLRLGVQREDIVLRNSRPVVVDVDAKQVRVTSAVFTAKNTDFAVTGSIGIGAKAPLNLDFNGSVNLGILQLLNPDLLAQGTAAMNTSVRGTIEDPRVNGRLELKGASLYLTDLPNGIDNANGVFLFDRSRATIEKLTAETGGGTLSFSGFVGFGGAELVYRLQATAQHVRIRIPEGASAVSNALLSLTGTSRSSVASGTVTVIRAGFNARTDLGAFFAEALKPVATPATPNEYLSGMQLDVRIESAPGLQFSTALTRDVQAEADLRLRGTPIRPVLLGTIAINQGQVQLFGNKYDISRGDIRFFNPVKIEPVFDLELETKARGITVNISLSGTANKVNLTYRSDPPLQSSEIIALLAVGRDPSANAGLAATQVTGQSAVEAGANALLGAAVAAPVSNRLQRFFGVSQLKIDPTLNGVDNRPQARLTVEQQVSKDITITYITNLNQTQEQIIRVEWDFNKNWSVIAVREETGVFGIDFQYRKRFK